MTLVLAQAILALHVAVIAFNVLGLVAIPIGAALRWAWVRRPLWRWAHVASWAAVALQAALGRACFLTDWQDALSGRSGAEEPLIMRVVNRVIFWPLPSWAFAAIYLVLFGLVLGLMRWVPARRG